MRYMEEICDVCGKRFSGVAINNHGSYDYINHTNFSHNISRIFSGTEDMEIGERINTIVKEFFTDGNKQIGKDDAVEFLECFKHYRYHDKELLEEVFQRIQNRIDDMNKTSYVAEMNKFIKKLELCSKEEKEEILESIIEVTKEEINNLA